MSGEEVFISISLLVSIFLESTLEQIRPLNIKISISIIIITIIIEIINIIVREEEEGD
jgi:hypothetical protein